MSRRMFFALLVIAVAAIALWLGRNRQTAAARPQPAAAGVLPDRKVFDAWQGEVRLDTRTDYGAGKDRPVPPAGKEPAHN